ncbi:MAG TPA: hypothetical protein VK614_06095 [Allosphingosinicella sp.]|nr:hypothetical protein [Allosphingosinicella sp.]
MRHTFLLLLAAASSPPNSARDAALESAHDYASCVGLTAVLSSATTRTIDEAVTAAFDQCSAKRDAALTAFTASFEALGSTAVRAAQEADQTLRENDQVMADRLRADIATFRRTGHPPTNAPN